MIRGGHMRASRTHAAGASSIARRAPRAGGRAAIARASLLEEVGARFGIGSEELRDERKEALLARIKTTNRGLGLSEEDAKEVDSLASALERINPTSSPLRSELVTGKWKLVYTTSQVRAHGGVSAPWDDSGIAQGRVLSPLPIVCALTPLGS